MKSKLSGDRISMASHISSKWELSIVHRLQGTRGGREYAQREIKLNCNLFIKYVFFFFIIVIIMH